MHLTLGRPGPARQATELAIERLDGSMVRDRAGHLARLAETYVADGEVEEACRLASEAVTIATNTQFDGAVLRVRKLRTKLELWAAEPAIQQLDNQLASTAP